MLFAKINSKIRNKRFNAYHKYYPLVCERRDFRSNRKILVIESDDWGSIRVSSLDAKKALMARGYDMDSEPFESRDALESNRDVEELYSVLTKFKDKYGRHPVITANCLTANPDFERIRESGFETYFFEPTSKTYQFYPDSERVLDLVNKGIELGVFYPQFHGREHFNFNNWIEQLRLGTNEEVIQAFNYRMCGTISKKNPRLGNIFMPALRYYSEDNKCKVVSSVLEGTRMFENQFGYKSKTFVAPCYWWSPAIEAVLSENGVGMIQTDRAYGNCDDGQIYYHYSGEKNRYKQFYSVRNCMFEPAINRNGNEAERCFGQIKKAFANRKIAVVSSHRVNYVGRIVQQNRDDSLKQLEWLLNRVSKDFPDIEFMSSEKLYEELYC